MNCDYLRETNFNLLTSTNLLKRLVGGDLIGFEKKGKDPFDDYNYAKIMINSNSMPMSQDESDGFYRRWLIIDFPNEF
jgi:putative DNA primase/helicase